MFIVILIECINAVVYVLLENSYIPRLHVQFRSKRNSHGKRSYLYDLEIPTTFIGNINACRWTLSYFS